MSSDPKDLQLGSGGGTAFLIANAWMDSGSDDLPKSFREMPALSVPIPQLPATGLSFKNVVDDFEADLIRQALERTQWNKNQAAQLLGLNRTTLLEKIKKKGLEHAEH